MSESPVGWVPVPSKLTQGMRVALENAIIRHGADLDRVWREVLDSTPIPPQKVAAWRKCSCPEPCDAFPDGCTLEDRP